LLVNDIVCIALTPLVLHLAHRLKLDPKPHLLGLALAANIGSTATLTGNPQNMIIGSLSGISYLRFAGRLAPIAGFGLVLGFLIVAWVCRDTLHADRSSRLASGEQPQDDAADGKSLRRPHDRLLIKSLLVTLAAVVLFFAGAPMPIVALGAAAVL